MRILLVGRLPSGEIGGACAYLALLAEGLSSHGEAVTVLHPHGAMEGAAPLPYDVVGAQARPIGPGLYGRAAGEVLAMRRSIASLRTDPRFEVVHLHYANAADLALLPPLRRLGKPLLVTAHCGAAWKHLRFAPRWSARRLALASRLLCLTRSQADLFRSAGFPPDRLRAAPTAVPTAFFSPVPRREREGPPRCLFLGRIVPEKGIDLLLAALAQIPRERRPLLDLMGPCDASYRARIERSAARAGLQDAVRFREASRRPSERIAALDAADLYVHPSRSDVAPLAVIEAMARGLPVAASALPGTTEILAGAGSLFPPGDAGRLAETLSGLLADAPGRARLGEKARARARDFTPEALVRAHLDLYAEAAGGRR